MRLLLGLTGLLGILALPPAARAADVNGTWKGSCELLESKVTLLLHLTADGGDVTGAVEGLAAAKAEIRDGKIDGDTLTFWTAIQYKGESYKLKFKGQVSGASDEIAFVLKTDDARWQTEMTARKIAEPMAAILTGTWKGDFDFEGSSVTLVFHLAASGDGVTGTIEGLPVTPAEIYDGKIDGDMVSFWVNTEYQGQSYKLLYKGKIAAGQIAFTFGTDDGSWGAQVTAAKAE
jgi:hypothetical protein